VRTSRFKRGTSIAHEAEEHERSKHTAAVSPAEMDGEMELCGKFREEIVAQKERTRADN
jgi:hypothetical protein